MIRKTIGKSVVLVTESSKLKETQGRRTAHQFRMQSPGSSFSFGAYDLLVPCAEAPNMQTTRKDVLNDPHSQTKIPACLSSRVQGGQSLAADAQQTLQVWHRSSGSGAWSRFNERVSAFLLAAFKTGASDYLLDEGDGRQVHHTSKFNSIAKRIDCPTSSDGYL